MKNTLILIITIIVTLNSCSQKRPTITTGFEGRPMPEFNLLLMDSTTMLNTGHILPGRPIVLFMFSPNCPYCRAQTEDMIRHINTLANIQFFMLSPFSFTSLKSFYQHYNLEKYANITMGQDYDFYFKKYFNASAVPYIAIYDKNKQLKEVLVGSVDTDVIKDIAFK